MNKMRVVFVFLVSMFILLGCAAPTPAAPTQAPTQAPAATATAANVSIKVFAPSSFTDAAKEIASAFEAANPGVKVAYEFGHTPTQRLQFTQGAMGDVFVTASQKDMDDAAADKTVASGTAKLFAMNQLVVVLPAKNPANVQKLEDLANPGVKLLVAVVDTPVGKVTLDALEKMDKKFGAGFKSKVVANVISNESGVKPIVSKIKLAEADAGIVYITDVVAAPELKTITIPADLNMVTQLNVAPLVKTDHPTAAASYTAFLTSADSQAILKKWGFMPGKP